MTSIATKPPAKKEPPPPKPYTLPERKRTPELHVLDKPRRVR